jgi:hypothetical protein
VHFEIDEDTEATARWLAGEVERQKPREKRLSRVDPFKWEAISCGN